MHSHQYYVQLVFIAIIFAYLSGCMVGPNFHKPPSPQANSYNETPLPSKTVRVSSIKNAGKSQAFLINMDIQENWWYLFHSRAINELIQTGLANNPSLAAAQASLKQAQEILRAQIGNTLFPAFDALADGSRQRTAAASFGGNVPSSIFNLYNVSASVSYTLDIFGGARREIESLQAQVDYQQFQVLATYLTLTANIVTTAITIASLEEQIQATHALIQAEEKQLRIMRNQFQVGGVADTNVLSQQTLVDQSRATLPPLEQSLSQSKHALSVLIGAYTNAPLPRIKLSSLTLPKQIPVSLPSKLVRQRPDVRAAEALLHSASAQIGVATANLFPQFTLAGGIGWVAEVPSSLFQSNNKVWDFGGKVTQPLFHGGALLAQRRAAIDAYDQANEQYRLVVLQAFQNVADSLRALETGAKAFKANKAAEISAYQTLKITQQQYFVGGVSYINLLSAQQQYQQTRLPSIQAQAARYTNTAALFQALGGGWWNRKSNKCHIDSINPTQETTKGSS
ncbi:MAG: RND transporter [Gammaproteobacteria bacterium RIFCSPHIGHO2_12_FULL_37_14]|nr:MAG: RND transporter [Gammaproteobacteria bacterium RIFCSPHIGHO2_12_FULL_37_14]